MRNRLFLPGVAALLALALVAETADAQWRGGRGWGGRGSSWNVGIGGGGIGIAYGRGWGGWPGYYGRGYSIGLGSPYYGSSYYGYYPGSYYYASPSYSYFYPSYTYSAPSYASGSVILNDGTMPAGAIQQAGFMNRGATQVALRVLLPDPTGRVWIEGQQMSLQGPERLFVSPALETGRNYNYTVRASWMENGREISRTRTINVQPGGEYVVNFHQAGDAAQTRDRATPPASERRDDGHGSDNRDRVPPRPTEPGLLDPDRPREFVVVSVSGDSLVVTDATGGNRQTFTVPASASIWLDGQTGALSDLREGQHVRLSMRGDAGNRTITRIEVQAKRDNP